MRREKANRIFNTKNIVGFIIAFIMVTSILAMWQGSPNDLEKYNGYSFTQKGDYITTKVNDKEAKDKEVKFYYHPLDFVIRIIFSSSVKEAKFYYHPTYIETINVTDSIISALKNTKMLYITFDDNTSIVQGAELARIDFEQQLPEYFDIYAVIAVTKNSTIYKNFPAITCKNATAAVPVLYMKEGEKREIYMENNCIVLEASEEADILSLKDRIMYGLFGIIK